MKITKRYNSKYLENIAKVLANHVKSNVKEYITLSIILFLGVIIGIILINNADEKSRNEVIGYINSFISNIKNENFEVDKVELTKNILLENLKLIFFIWIAGTTIIGIPLIYLIIAYKGICLGYTISSIIATLGSGKRFYIFN